jgi:hypothetical protein
MSRVLLAFVVTAVIVVGWLAAPDRLPPDEAPGLEPAAAAAAVCAVRLDRTADGVLTIGSTVIASARITVANAGTVGTDRIVEMDEAGGGAVRFADLTIGGAAGAFVEFGIDTAAAAVVSRGDAGVTAAACPTLLRTTSVIAGSSTRNGESLELILVNPYGSDAVVAVESSSEIGADSADELSAVVVPARSTVTRDLATLLPLRNQLSLAISPVRGLVHAFVEGGGRGDRVVIEQAAPAGQWVTPVPAVENADLFLVVASVSPIEVALRIDGWSDGGLVEGVVSQTIPPREQIAIRLADLETPVDILQVLADGPIGVSLVMEGDGGRAATPINAEALPEWLMPGPGDAGSVAYVGNPGETDGVVEFQSLATGGESFAIEVGAGAVVAVPLDGQLVGYALRADVPITVVWSVSDETGIGLGAPMPLHGGE